MCRPQNIKEFKSILKQNGYQPLRNAQGSHVIYSNGERKVSVPFTSRNPMLYIRLMKEYGLAQ